jgi:hypothetical protein
MSTTYKTFLDDDVVSTKTLLHENIPITGTIVSSSVYLTSSFKSFSHGMFQSVYDYPYLSSSANQLFDMTVGQSAGSPGSSSLAIDTYAKKKINIYNQMAQVLVGYDTTGSILKFDRDGNSATTTDNYYSMYFLNFSRLLVKDEIKKGTFEMLIGAASSSATPFTSVVRVYDASGSSNYLVNSPAGEYGILYAENYTGTPLASGQTNKRVGFVFYQAGVVALSTGIFTSSGSSGILTSMSGNQQGQLTNGVNVSANNSLAYDVQKMFQSGTIDQANAGLRARIQNITFNNTTELNSAIHFCRISHNDFNYSSNPTYLSSSKLIVKEKSSDAPVSYFTTVGLYSPDNELLAVAKVSEPLKKDPTQEMILRVRLDY